MPSESLFYYDIDNGYDYEYYNTTRSQSYTPMFDIQPTAQQQQQAQSVCTVDGVFSETCAYDLYATGNAQSSAVTAYVDNYYIAAQNSLGLYVMLFASCVDSVVVRFISLYTVSAFYRLSRPYHADAIRHGSV